MSWLNDLSLGGNVSALEQNITSDNNAVNADIQAFDSSQNSFNLSTTFTSIENWLKANQTLVIGILVVGAILLLVTGKK